MENDNPQYIWSELDKFLNIIVKSGQKLYFELMGNPEGYHFGDPKNDKVWTPGDKKRWTRFVKDLVLHLECKDANPDLDKCFGEDVVRSWYFQTWNEPNKHIPFKWFDEYYMASLKGLDAADKDLLRFGGPAINQLLQDGFSPYLENFLKWINKDKKRRLDYISYHYKGLPEDQVDAEIKAIDFMKDFQDKPFFNEEADSEGGWWKNLEHRATPWYAAFIARNIDEHLTRIIDEKGIEYRLHNDNAFLRVTNVVELKKVLNKKKKIVADDYEPSVGAWEQRTHFAHFVADPENKDDNQNFALIKKPAHNVMTMLSLLGNEYELIETNNSNGVGAIATKRGENQVAILVYRYDDEYEKEKGPIDISLTLENLPFQTGIIAHYRLDKDEKHSNTYQKWRSMKGIVESPPNVPSDTQIQELRSIQELGIHKDYPISKLEPVDFDNLDTNTVTLDTFKLPMPGVSLILISQKPDQCPAPITEVYKEEPLPSLNGNYDEYLIRWDSGSRFIQSYDVYYSDSEEGPFTEKVNIVDLITTAYIHRRPVQMPAYYKVVARDYWGRTHESDDCAKKGFKLDLGETEQYVQKDGQSQWREWSDSGNDTTRSRVFSADFDDEFTITLENVDWRIRGEVDKSQELKALIEDAVKNSSAFSVIFKDLDPGDYQITTYHHDSNEADGTLDIDLTDADGDSTPVDDLMQSGGTNPVSVAKATFEFRSDGRDVVLTIADNNDGGFNEAFLNGMELVKSLPVGYKVEIEAEIYDSAVGDWTDGPDTNASGGIYMVAPKGTGNDRQCTGLASGKEHYMEYSFMAPGDGKHYVWVRGIGNGGGHDSVCVSVDSGQLIRLNITTSDVWKWNPLPNTWIDFARNSTHNLKIHLREDNTYVDKILITADAQFEPID